MDMSSTDSADVNSHITQQVMQQLTQSATAKFVWMVSKVLVTAFVSGCIAIGVSYVRDMRDDIRSVMIHQPAQDQAQALTDQRVDSLERVSNATVVTLQQLGQQVEHNTDDIGVVRDQVQRGDHR